MRRKRRKKKGELEKCKEKVRRNQGIEVIRVDMVQSQIQTHSLIIGKQPFQKLHNPDSLKTLSTVVFSALPARFSTEHM